MIFIEFTILPVFIFFGTQIFGNKLKVMGNYALVTRGSRDGPRRL